MARKNKLQNKFLSKRNVVVDTTKLDEIAESKIQEIMKELRQIPANRKKRTSNIFELGILLWELGIHLKWEVKSYNMELLRKTLKKFKFDLEDNVDRLATVMGSEDTEKDNMGALTFCRSASGVELMREISNFHVLRNNDYMELQLLYYLEACPPMDITMFRYTAKLMCKIHWWWIVVLEKGMIRPPREVSLNGRNTHEIAMAKYTLANYRDALRYFRETSIESPSNLMANYYISKCHYKLGQYEDAIIQCKKAIALGRELRGDVKIVTRAMVLQGRSQLKIAQSLKSRRNEMALLFQFRSERSMEEAMSFLAKIAKVKLEKKGWPLDCIKFCNLIADIGKRNEVNFEFIDKILGDTHLKAITCLSDLDSEGQWNVGKVYLYLTKILELCRNYYSLRNKTLNQYVTSYNLINLVEHHLQQNVSAKALSRFKKQMEDIKVLRQKTKWRIDHFPGVQHIDEGAGANTKGKTKASHSKTKYLIQNVDL